MTERQLFVFWQFAGNNEEAPCNNKCPYCYGGTEKQFKNLWSGDISKWEQAFERLNRDIYFVFSYGECTVSDGFRECVAMIGRHPTWTLNIITNLTQLPEWLLQSHLAKDKRLFVTACWHPLGVVDKDAGWENFKRNLLRLKAAGLATNVMMVWYKPQIKWFPLYFEWLDSHGFRVNVRRYVSEGSFWQKIPYVRRLKWFVGKAKLEDYSEAERGYLYASTCPKVTAYALDLESCYGKLCIAGKDMILVKHDGTVTLCACCYGSNHELGNIFDVDFKLNSEPIKCPTNNCGGDFGMLVLPDNRFGALPTRLWRDTFVSQVEDIPDGVFPVPYPRRKEMLEWLEKLKNEQKSK